MPEVYNNANSIAYSLFQSFSFPAINQPFQDPPILPEFRVSRVMVHTFKSSGWTTVNNPAINRDKSPPRTTSQLAHGSKSVLGFSDAELLMIANGQKLQMKPFHIRTMIRWMKTNNARTMGRREQAFDPLLRALGFAKRSFSRKLLEILKTKARVKISSLGRQMAKNGAVTIHSKNQTNQPVTYAPWTEVWLSPTWDGSISKPSHWISPSRAEKNNKTLESDDWAVEERFLVDNQQADGGAEGVRLVDIENGGQNDAQAELSRDGLGMFENDSDVGSTGAILIGGLENSDEEEIGK